MGTLILYPIPFRRTCFPRPETLIHNFETECCSPRIFTFPCAQGLLWLPIWLLLPWRQEKTEKEKSKIGLTSQIAEASTMINGRTYPLLQILLLLKLSLLEKLSRVV